MNTLESNLLPSSIGKGNVEDVTQKLRNDLNRDNQSLKQGVGVNIAEQKGNELISQREKQAPAAEKENLFDEIRANLEKINEFIPVQSTSLVFEFDELGEPPVVKVLDKTSNEVIREIPPREFREMAKALDEVADKLTNTKGVLFNDLV